MLLLVPFKNYIMRYLAILSFVGLHFGILVTLHLGNFPWVCFALWFAILPTQFWDFFAKKYENRGQGYELFYDHECGFCRKFCLLLKSILFLNSLKISKSADDQEANEVIIKDKSWFLRSEQGKYKRFLAFSKLIEISSFGFVSPILYLAPVRRLGDFAYKMLSQKGCF